MVESRPAALMVEGVRLVADLAPIRAARRTQDGAGAVAQALASWGERRRAWWARVLVAHEQGERVPLATVALRLGLGARPHAGAGRRRAHGRSPS